MNDLPPGNKKDVSLSDQPAGTPVIRNIVGTTGVSNNVLQSAQNLVPSRRKTRTAVTLLTGRRHKDSTAAFEKFIKDLKEATVLYHPAADGLLAIVVDASDTTVGQHRYSAYNRKLMAAFMAIKYFRHMVEGRSFTLLMDHKPLIYAFKQKEDKCSPQQLQ
ncbi:transposon Ty3-I Gag-Pol polyprotein [Nephila pilipes]|uniref:Transposon Ty3-I Gag-Pol polyprotein n=1 Tax=Nephila pilipes TaxID=299642 RepID=A0A8X6TAC3_NEPPI|nr:transposon Ty3-I Gag-Pol polyprotein [Nephila pilipes]